MHIQDEWRVLTVGDGDLSFSLALAKRFPEINLCASVLDSEEALRDKYSLNAIDDLKTLGHNVVFELDITSTDSITSKLSKSFDLAIFQFPLVPNAGARRPGQSWHQGTDSNLENRKLLRAFLFNAAKFLLRNNGANLCYITSKDVKPYCDWNIENLGHGGILDYIGECEFNPNLFPGYRIRNVDRDKQVKSTSATTYVWSSNAQQHAHMQLTMPKSDSSDYCALCKVGPIKSPRDWQAHTNSRLHRRRTEFQNNWEAFLQQ
ncbi:MAG: DUF2431 domain-containing protein [Alteromonadaceae bacterium]|nr:DUF2431 domain-containing protein [Alteromonadaceae bacterium]